MVFDEKGQVDIFECKIEVCVCVYKILIEQVDFNFYDIIFDFNVLVVVMGIEEYDNYVVDFIKVIGWIKKNLFGVYVSGGVSNLLFFFCGNNYICEVMYVVFFYYVIC